MTLALKSETLFEGRGISNSPVGHSALWVDCTESIKSERSLHQEVVLFCGLLMRFTGDGWGGWHAPDCHHVQRRPRMSLLFHWAF